MLKYLLVLGYCLVLTAVFKMLLKRANQVALYSEEIDPHIGRFPGNLLQAFTHLGLINSALNLDGFIGMKNNN